MYQSISMPQGMPHRITVSAAAGVVRFQNMPIRNTDAIGTAK
jgi:hypothetical protein